MGMVVGVATINLNQYGYWNFFWSFVWSEALCGQNPIKEAVSL